MLLNTISNVDAIFISKYLCCGGTTPLPPSIGSSPFPIVRRVSRRRLARAVAFVWASLSIRRNSACGEAPGNAASHLTELWRQIQPGLDPKEDGNFGGREDEDVADVAVVRSHRAQRPRDLYCIPGQDVGGGGAVSATPGNHPTRRLPHEVRHHQHRRPPRPARAPRGVGPGDV